MNLNVNSLTVAGLTASRASASMVIAGFGYETRATRFCEIFSKCGTPAKFVLLDYTDLRVGAGRAHNADFLRQLGAPTFALSSNDTDFNSFLEIVEQTLTDLRNTVSDHQRVDIHLDYSCMPRVWYCRLAQWLSARLLLNEALCVWYTPGAHETREFRPSGIDDFVPFSGRASLSARSRTHIVGLGFEADRSRAILTVVDPEYLICYFADPGVDAGFVQRVWDENAAVINAAQQFFPLPLNDFGLAYAQLRSVVCDFRKRGDVVLIPDGPKPFTLIASLLPSTVEQPGVTCLHIKRRTREEANAADVLPACDPFGGEIKNVTDSDTPSKI